MKLESYFKSLISEIFFDKLCGNIQDKQVPERLLEVCKESHIEGAKALRDFLTQHTSVEKPLTKLDMINLSNNFIENLK